MTEKSLKILSSASGTTLREQCLDIVAQLDACLAAACITFFLGARGADGYAAADQELRAACREALGEKIPLVTCVAQMPVDGRLVAEVLCLPASGGAAICMHGDYCVIRSGPCVELLTQGLRSPSAGDAGQQAADVFARLQEILDTEGFEVSDIVRQWNYIEDITGVVGGRQNYQMFNDARSSFYGRACWSNGYPAATGIGCAAGGIMVAAYAVRDPDVVSRPIDNPLQVPAHRYSGKVLEAGKGPVRTTPKFERARLLGDRVLVSGTAAIKGEDSEISQDAALQSRAALEVMDSLVAAGNIGCSAFRFDAIRVYIKHATDIGTVKECLSRHWAGIPIHYLIADICRPELLLELEGIGTVS